MGALSMAGWDSRRPPSFVGVQAAEAEAQALSHGRLSASPPLSGSQRWSALRGEPFRFPSLSSPSFPRFCNQGLTVSPPLQNYEHLFKVNDKSVGGSFYLQSKVSAGRVGRGIPHSWAVQSLAGEGCPGLRGPPELPGPCVTLDGGPQQPWPRRARTASWRGAGTSSLTCPQPSRKPKQDLGREGAPSLTVCDPLPRWSERRSVLRRNSESRPRRTGRDSSRPKRDRLVPPAHPPARPPLIYSSVINVFSAFLEYACPDSRGRPLFLPAVGLCTEGRRWCSPAHGLASDTQRGQGRQGLLVVPHQTEEPLPRRPQVSPARPSVDGAPALPQASLC